MDEFSGLGMTSAFCPTFFFSLMCIYTTFLFSRFHQMYKISGIYSVNGSQETEKHEIFPARAISIVNG